MLNAIRPLSAGLEARLRSIIRKRIYRKGELLLRIGEVSRHILYLRSGLVRSYYFYRGRQVSNWFMREGDVCVSILSFFEQIPAVDNIMALEDCECWGITFDELEETYALFPEFNLHGRLIDNKYYCWSERRNQSILRQTPGDKYAQLMEKDPDLVRRVPVNDLASFLNVSERTLYAIRRAHNTPSKRRR